MTVADNNVSPTDKSDGIQNGILQTDVSSDPSGSPDLPEKVVDDPAEIDRRWGYFGWRPNFLQVFDTPQYLLAAMSFFAFLEALVEWGLVNICMSSWERRYSLPSSKAAWIISGQDLAAGILAPICGYLAGFWHKGKILTSGAITMFIGYTLFCFPQIFSGLYSLGAGSSPECDPSGNSTEDCGFVEETHESMWLVCFVIAQLFFGLTGSVLYGVGLTYMDDNIHFTLLPLYAGVMNAMSAVGAVCGFLFGGLSLQLYVDFARIDMDDISISPDDPRWVGAWWISFAVGAVLAFICMFVMAGFPRELPAALENRATRQSQAHKDQTGGKLAQDGMSGKDILVSLKVIFTNPVFVLMTCGGILESGAIVAFAAFLPKMLQFQFSQTASMAALVAGAVLVPGAALGQLIGGLIPRWFNLRLRGLIWEIIICQIICVALSFCVLLKCPMPSISGVTTAYPIGGTNDSLWTACNSPCNCTTYSYDPICGKDDNEFFSPCFAGCTDSYKDGDTQMYTNCACVSGSDPSATNGACGSECWQFWLFVPLFLIIIIATFAESTAGQASVIRCVPDRYRSFAYGIQGPLVRYLGNVPIPIIFGMMFDQACIVWQDHCGDTGSCWIYANDDLAVYLFLCVFVVKILSGLFNFAAVMVYKPPPEEDDLAPVEMDVSLDGKEGSGDNSEVLPEEAVEDHTSTMPSETAIAQSEDNNGFDSDEQTSQDTPDEENVITAL